MHWEIRKFRLSHFIAIFLYCNGLELNLQYFQGVPVSVGLLVIVTIKTCLHTFPNFPLQVEEGHYHL